MSETQRPSVKVYGRTDPRWRLIVEDTDASPYGFGYACAQLDQAAGLPAMTETEMSSLWHPDYTEGYLDAYADHARFGS